MVVVEVEGTDVGAGTVVTDDSVVVDDTTGPTSVVTVDEFDAADAVLTGQMDALVGQFRATEPALVEAYRTARALVHLKATRGKPTSAAGPGTAGNPAKV